jgi:hypothetical protein
VKDSLNVPYVFFTSQGKSPKQLPITAVLRVRNFLPKLWDVQFVYCTECDLVWIPPGREKNPQFIEQVAAHFDKQDNIVVVLLMIYPFLFRSIVFIGHGLCVFFFWNEPSKRAANYINKEEGLCVFYAHIDLSLDCYCVDPLFFPSKGCKSGVRSELACFDLMAAVRSLPFPLTFPWGFSCHCINMQHKPARLHIVHPIRFMVWNLRP